MKLIFMGTPDFAAETLKALVNSRHFIQLVVSQPDKPRGRSREFIPTEVKTVALEAGLPVFQPEKIKTPETMEKLASCQPDLIVVAAYGRIIPESILKLPKYGCINLHASLLPKYRGAAPIQWAVLNGEKVTGVTVQQMNTGLDTGDILSARTYELSPKETSASLFERLASLGADLLLNTLDDIEKGMVNPVRQPEESPTPYARMITKEDGRIDWSWNAGKIERWVRGMNSWPGAYTFFEKKNVKLWDCEVVPENTDLAPGTITAADRHHLLVQTGAGQIKINELQMQGKKRMDFAAFLRGCRWKAGMRFNEEESF